MVGLGHRISAFTVSKQSHNEYVVRLKSAFWSISALQIDVQSYQLEESVFNHIIGSVAQIPPPPEISMCFGPSVLNQTQVDCLFSQLRSAGHRISSLEVKDRYGIIAKSTTGRLGISVTSNNNQPTTNNNKQQQPIKATTNNQQQPTTMKRKALQGCDPRDVLSIFWPHPLTVECPPQKEKEKTDGKKKHRR